MSNLRVVLVCSLVLLVASQSTAAEDDEWFRPVDLETPEYLVIYNQHTDAFDIYALEHPGLPIASDAASEDAFDAADATGAYAYESQEVGLSWSPLKSSHAPADGMVDARIVIKPPATYILGRAIADLVDRAIRPSGCGADFAKKDFVVDGAIQSTKNWWLFEGLTPNRQGGWDGILEYCNTTT